MADRDPQAKTETWRGEAAAEMRLMQHLQRAIPEAEWDELASLLQLQSIPIAKKSELDTPTYSTSLKIVQIGRKATNSEDYPPAKKNLPHLYLHGIRQRKQKVKDDRPNWYEKTKAFDQQIESPMDELSVPEPLVKWEEFWPRLHLLFADKKQTRNLDEKKVIRQVLRQQPFTDIPWRQKACWPNELWLIVDYSPHLSPWFHDFEQLAYRLMRWFRRRIKLLICTNAERQLFQDQFGRESGFPDCPENAEILYLGDLGLLDRQGFSRSGWLELGRMLWRRNARLEAMLTVHPSDWDTGLMSLFKHHYIDSTLLHGGLSPQATGSEQQTENILAYLSPAFELNPAMVRKARQRLGYHLSVESLIFQHQAIRSNAVIYQWSNKEVRNHYRDRFNSLGYSLSEAWQLIQGFESVLPMELQVEQRQQLGQTISGEQRSFLRRLVRTLDESRFSVTRSDMLRDWIVRAANRAGKEVWSGEMLMLYGLYRNQSEDKSKCILPSGVDLTKIPKWTGDVDKTIEVSLVQRGDKIVATEALQQGIELARFSFSGEAEIQFYKGKEKESHPLLLEREIDLPQNLKRLKIQTREQMLKVAPMKCPKWACGIGRDKYGLFVEVEVQGVEFVMRWIPPGEFMMGSPEDEPQRYDDEGPQHRVVFEQGYWLAETACTQELWQSVMKNVPSEFKDNPQNPVENVAWKDADKFSKIINKQLGDGAFRLPSEAEWEYACRAGTVTPFWWGNELSTDQANYNGKHPYNDGNKGEYRSKTLPVKSFHPNPWGLYQMHGNVWEWCQDRWHDDYRDAPDNGEPWEEGDSESRVCRGGSWFDHGRYLRSASRLHDFFGDGSHGFRLARGPESSRQARAGEAVGRQGGRDDRQTRHGIDGGGENENQDL